MIQKETLKEVLLENRQEVMRHHVISRDLHLDDFPRQVLVGVRRSGKSYMLYERIQQLINSGMTWDDIIYVNFEDERLIGMTVDDLNTILEVHGEMSGRRPMLFLDEIQNIQGWDKFARRLADNEYEVAITGSNAKMLSDDVATTLGGRYLVKEVFPFNFVEYLRAKGVDATNPDLLSTTEGRASVRRLFEEYFKFGGFPEAIQLSAKRDYLTSLFQKLYLGDIASRHNIGNVLALRILYRKLVESVKQPVSYTRMTDIVKSTGTKIGKDTIINYIDYSEAAFLLLPVSNFADNLTGKATNRKYYFIDNSIISLLGIDVRTSLLENMVAVALMRKFGKTDAVYHYSKGIEVDFYVPEEELAIQVCYNIEKDPYTKEREIEALSKLRKHLPCRECLIITFDEQEMIEKDGVSIRVLPAWKWLMG